MHDLTSLSIADVLQMTEGLRTLEDSALSMEEAAQRIARYLYDNLGEGEGEERGCALVRVYRTVRFQDLDVMLRGFARSMAGGMATGHEVQGDTACLTLLATVGDEPVWNHRQRSIDHQAIPLVSEEVVHQLPMIAQLIRQLGVEVRDVLQADPDLLVDPSRKTHNVFWVEEAKGSPYIPAQERFVLPYCIQSVVGFGGILSGGELFATILFSKVRIAEEQARRFSSLTLTVRGILSACDRNNIFALASPKLVNIKTPHG